MTRALTLLAVSALALSLAACGKKPAEPQPEVQGVESLGQIVPMDKHEAMTAYAAGMGRIADAVESAHDAPSASAAALKIKATNAELRTIASAFKDMSEDDMAATALASMEALMGAQTRISAALASLEAQDPAAAKTLRSELDLTPDF
jgi:hypothetical protein